MKIESKKTEVTASIEDVYKFLIVPSNIEALLPKDNIKDFTADDKSCSFKVQGGFTITLIQESMEENKSIKFKSGEKSPFPFNLSVELTSIGDNTEGHLLFDGEVNTFMQMMVKKPLTNLFDYMSHKLKSQFE